MSNIIIDIANKSIYGKCKAKEFKQQIEELKEILNSN